MANAVVGTVTLLSDTGSKTVNLGLTPYYLNVRVASISGSGDSYYHTSYGSYAQGYQAYHYDTGSSTGPFTSGKIFSVKDNTGTVVFEGSVSSIGTGTVTFNVTTSTLVPNPTMYIEALA